MLAKHKCYSKTIFGSIYPEVALHCRPTYFFIPGLVTLLISGIDLQLCKPNSQCYLNIQQFQQAHYKFINYVNKIYSIVFSHFSDLLPIRCIS